MKVSKELAIELLKSGEVVAVPTETVYGLGASYLLETAVQKLFHIKNRPQDNPLIIHISSIEEFKDLSLDLPKQTEDLIKAFWPGPLTLVVKARVEKIHPVIRANLETVAFRMSSHPVMQEIIEATGPLVAPSANLSTRPSSTSFEHVEEDFGVDFPVVDGGICDRGVESTILVAQDEKFYIGRLGALSAEMFLPILGYLPEMMKKSSKPLCPGSRYRHYAPKATLYLGLKNKELCEAVIGFEERQESYQKPFISLGSIDDPQDGLKRLYAALRMVDTLGFEKVAIDDNFANEGLFKTLHERLQKASSSEKLLEILS